MKFKEKDRNYTKLTLKIGDRVTTTKIAGTDPTATDILEMLYGCMVGQTFMPVTVIDSMRDFAEDNTEWCECKESIDNSEVIDLE